jgi:gliding motility-associated lipoprotein GldH
MFYKMKNIFFALFLTSFCGLLNSCQTIDVFEKNVEIPNFQWSSSFQPSISFDVKDTTAFYHIYAVIRHTDAYRYKNLWLNIQYQIPGEDSVRNSKVELMLGDDEKGWTGSGMDDIFEHRVLIDAQPVKFVKAGNYTFQIAQIMREDPLLNVMNAGIRVEKIP